MWASGDGAHGASLMLTRSKNLQENAQQLKNECVLDCSGLFGSLVNAGPPVLSRHFIPSTFQCDVEKHYPTDAIILAVVSE